MANPTASSAGISEQVFIQQVREDLEDVPVFVGTEVLSANGTSSVYRIPTAPVYDGDVFGGLFWNITAGAGGGTPQALIGDKTSLAGANNVYVEFQTGLCTWAVAPAAGTNNVAFTHSKARWLDRRILKALRDGMRAMFPMVWQYQTDTSITLATNQWDYNLPTPLFFDPRIRIMQVEIQQTPTLTERFIPKDSWRRVGNTILHISNAEIYSPGAVVRVHFTGPYQSLSEMEEQIQNIPVLYAKGMLLLNKEAPRTRADQAAVVQNESANPAGTQSNLGVAYLRQFEIEINRLKRVPIMPNLHSTYTN